MFAKLTALQAVDNWVHAGVEYNQSRGDCVMDSNERDASSKAQKINQKLWDPAQHINDCHENNHLGHTLTVAFQSLLSFLANVILSDPKTVHHSRVKKSHKAKWNNTSHHRPPNGVEVPENRFGPAVSTTSELLDVGDSYESRNGPESGK